MATKKMLNDSSGQIWPITRSDCVYMPGTSTNIKDYIDNELKGKANSSHGTHLTLGTTSSTAYRGDYGNTAYNHSQSAHAPSNAQKNSDITKSEIEAKLTGTISSHNHSGTYAPASHNHSFLSSSDTRNTNPDPNTYATFGITPEFKSSSTIGLPNVGKNFAGVITYQQWADLTNWTGGKTTQFATIDDGRMYFRKGDGSGWGSWYQFYTTANKPTPADIGAAVASHGTHLTLGTGSGNAYRGDYGNTAYTHSQAAHAPSNAQKNSDITKAEIEAKLTGNSITSHRHEIVTGVYTSNGGAQPPSYISGGTVKFNMMNKFKGLNGLPTYADCILMDTYTGSDVPYVTGFGILKTSGDPRAFIAVGAKGNTTTWSKETELLTVANYKTHVTPANIGAAASSHGTHLTLGTGSGNAYRGDYGNTAYTHSQAAHAPSNAQKNSDITKAEIEAKLTGAITSHTHSYLPLSGGEMTGRLRLTTAATTTDASAPTQLAYGLLGAYGTLKILGNTDTSAGADNEYVHIASGWGLSPAADKGILVRGTYAECFGGTIRPQYSKTIDLTASTYNVNTWYPCVPANSMPYRGLHRINLAVQLNSGSKPSWSTHDSGFTCNIDVLATAGGWGTTSANSICLQDYYNWANNRPAGYQQLNNSSKPLFYLRGGGKYTIYTDYDTGAWTVYTTSTTLNSETFAPTTTAPGVSINRSTVTANISGNASSASKLETARTLTIGNTGKSFNGSGNVSWTVSEIGAAASSHNHTSLTGVTSLAFATHADDSASITTSVSGNSSYMDFNMSDDAGSDMWRWRFTAWDGSAGAAAPTFNAMTLIPTTPSKAQLQVKGDLVSMNGSNGGIWTNGGLIGLATSDGSTFQCVMRYDSTNSWAALDVGHSTLRGAVRIRSGQGTAGSGISILCAVTNGTNYVQWLSPQAGTIALTSHLSDRTRKDDVVYVGSENSEFTNKDFYNFVRDDLGLATYNLKEEYAATDTHTKLNFIAQDILWNFEKNEENKVGNLIVQAEKAMEEQESLQYDPDNYVSVLAGALKEAINKIEELEAKNKVLEELEAKNKVLEELVYSLSERLSKLENK